jgi:hypothetical protein
MKERARGEDFGAMETAWKLFEKTGSITYYLLYHELKQKDKDDKKHR